jgi:hypothetical protein
MVAVVLFDASRCYRYRLGRAWAAPGTGCVLFVMLNPSTADAEHDDPTLRRCIWFAHAWGFGAVDVMNLFAYRAPRPQVLRRVADPVGPDNDRHIDLAAGAATAIVCAWAEQGGYRGRGADVALALRRHRPLLCLGSTKNGQPLHPLYVRGTTRPTVWMA